MASTALTPYLNFNGNAREAMELYQSILGGELTCTTFAQGGGVGMDLPEADDEKIMHSQIDKDGEPVLMGADMPSVMPFAAAAGMTVSLSGDDEDTLTGWWHTLSDGATVGQELTKAPWGDTFGMLTDRYGTPWLVNITGSHQDG